MTPKELEERLATDGSKAVGSVHRHAAQGGPKEDAEHSKWRYSLMNRGNDPLN